MDHYQKYALGAHIKKMAHSLGSDLVGFANVERFANAPAQMSPQGILPTARTVIVCGIHHPDATIEIDGEPSAHTSDSYGVQMSMNYKLDRLSFRIACMLEDLGYSSVPIAGSNIWRYKQYKELKAVFAPDISHIYAAVAAGLTELGWNGLSLSPEYGARNRFVSIITEAEISPTPLYNGEKLCDMCGECIQHCPMQAFTKEVRGVNNVRIEDKDNKFANKNLWRCAWAEHFALDLDKEIPEIVDEPTIVETVEREGLRGGTLGTCLKVCVPPNLRVRKEKYTRYTTRQNQFTPTGRGVPRKFIDQAIIHAHDYAADRVQILSKETAKERGIDLTDMMPDAKAAIVLSATHRIDGYDKLTSARKHAEPKKTITDLYREEGIRNLNFAAMDIARMFDTVGIAAISQSGKMNRAIEKTKFLGEPGSDETIIHTSVILNEALPEMDVDLSGTIKPLKTRNDLESLAKEYGFNLFGVTDSDRLTKVAEQLKGTLGEEVTLDSIDLNGLFRKFNPDTVEQPRDIRDAKDILPSAKSVLVMGLRYPAATVERAGKPPAESVGPYAFVQYHAYRELTYAAMRMVRRLQEQGYEAVLSHDVLNLGDFTGSPRGLHSAPINNTIEAVCAGIGQLTYNRNVYTPEYGINQRFIAVITNMDVTPDAVKPQHINKVCAACKQCVTACPTGAIDAKSPVSFAVDGQTATLLPIDRNRCRWASLYALSNKDGFEYNGSTTNIPIPDIIDVEGLNKALRQRDPINKFRPIIVQSCVAVCPLATRKAAE
ncbi:MAG: hypothetical protein ACOX55_02035 [Christensenellales bacterium]|jgi:epoxyqueuosine reductase